MNRVATDLENMEKSGNLKVIMEKSGNMCSCLWCDTESSAKRRKINIEHSITASVADNAKQ